MSARTSSSSETPAIEVAGLTKRYGSPALALDNLSLTVRPGEVFGFLGPNGAGKTTAIRILLDLIRPTSGKASVLGLDCQRDSIQVRRHVGYLPGDLRLYEDMTPGRLFRLFAELRPHTDALTHAGALASRLDLAMDTPMGRLSKGNRQKVGIVVALMSRPAVVVLDEPTSGLDPLVQHKVLEALGEVKASGRTVFFSSHVISEVETVCDRVGIIRNGRLVAVEDVSALHRKRAQRLRIVFNAPVNADAFANVQGARVLGCDGQAIELEVTGDVDAVLRAALCRHVVSIETSRPTLEEVFMSFYGPGEEGKVASGRHGDA